MHQSKAPQLRLNLADQLPLKPHEQEKVIALLAALLLDVAESEAADEER
ncbi:MAG: hypothetical protein ACYDDQ_00415 [Vulcanimicrobiaceae bacterium]